MVDLPLEEIHAYMDRMDRTRGQQLASANPTQMGSDGNIDAEAHLFGKDGFGFDDLIDIINPLQHLPIISSLYRELTGDTIAKLPRILGGALFGGPIGAGVAVVNAAIAEESGKDIGGHVIAMFKDEGTTATAETPATDPAESKLVTAAGSPSSKDQKGKGESLALQNNQGPVVAATQAELDILKQESNKKYKQTAERQTPSPISAMPVVTATTAEQNILQLERALTRLTENNNKTNRKTNGSAVTPKKVADKTTAPTQAATARASKFQRSSGPGPWYSFETKKPISTSQTSVKNNGSVADNGGWFSDVMLVALDKYQKTQKLNKAPPQPTINKLNQQF